MIMRCMSEINVRSTKLSGAQERRKEGRENKIGAGMSFKDKITGE